jgi:nucleoside-diphosphate-sugar epimerase
MSESTPGPVLVTGATGFVGRALCEALTASSRRVRRAVRRVSPGDSGAVAVGDVTPDTDWRAALEGVQCVVHLVSPADVPPEASTTRLDHFRKINVGSTLRLAEQARHAGARRLVFMSSIKVNGESTQRPLAESDAPRPEDAYGVSKWEAEQALARFAAASGLEIVVLRPPLVYGPQVKGNFLRLLDIVARGTPLPLASVANRRSLVYIGNLVDAVIAAMNAPQAAGRTYLVSDGEDVATPALVREMAAALGVRPRLFPCPVSALNLAASAIGKSAEARRLTGSLQIDSSAIRRELGWQPPYTLAQGLAETARWYHARARSVMGDG